MEALIHGLNTYIGLSALKYLQDPSFKMHGIVRDLNLFNKRVVEPNNLDLIELDLIRLGDSYSKFSDDNLNVGYYFTQVHDFSDELTLNLEILSLTNYINLLNKSNCNRLIYVARLMDKRYLQIIEKLFVHKNIDYTIVLKNVAIGKGSILDIYIKNLLKFSYVPYVKSIALIKSKPVDIKDVLKFLKIIAIENRFIGQTIGFGGPEEMTFQKLVNTYARRFSSKTKFHSIRVPKFILDIIHKKYHLVNEEDHLEFNRFIKYEYPINNQAWSDQMTFQFTPIEQTICLDC